MIRTPRLALSFILVLGCLFAKSQTAFPKVIPFKSGGSATIYQPQPETLEGNKIIGRSAVSVKMKPTSEPVFGVMYYVSYISTDKASRTATLDSITITNAKFSGVDNQARVDSLARFIEMEVPKWDMEISLDALVATIKRDHPNAEIYNNDPPKIIYSTKPSSLVIIDGEPKIQKDKDLDAERVVNTPSLIFREGAQWNLYDGGVWYKSASVTSGWTAEEAMSQKVKSIDDQIKKQEKENNGGKVVTEKPEVTEIIVSTVPAEVIQSKGEPTWKTIEGTKLSYISNSPNNIIKDNNTQLIYILIAGRWYKSNSFKGPWTFNEPDKLPGDFSKIPEGSEKDNVLASVAGTDAAEEAMIDSEIPQTAKVNRKTATVKVEYDGSPLFNPIEGTSLQLAENSSLTVFKDAGGKYFVLDNGVWFTGSSATGPWNVATERPKDVENIQMKNKAYNAKFVHIYQVTPEYTIQGYTAGYLGSYIQGDPVLVFGTGFYYAPWYGAMYYPAPVTWGFGFSYNPWYGWSMGVGYNVGFLHVGFAFGGGYGYGGWYGPPMYRPPYYRPPYGGGGYYGRPGGGNQINHYGNNNININTGNQINTGDRNNLYKDKPGVSTKDVKRTDASSKINNNKATSRPGSNAAARPGNTNGSINNRPAAKPGTGSNNIYGDRDGNVYQRDNKGNVSQRDNQSKNWKPSAGNQPSPGNVNRDMQARDRGTQRSSNYNSYQNRSAARPSGGARMGGGGGRRR